MPPSAAAAAAPAPASSDVSSQPEVERLRAEVEAINAAKRKLTIELKAAKAEVDENSKKITVLKAQLSRFVKNVINPEATADSEVAAGGVGGDLGK
jgi:predicted  nucleic acid-binding Zn-ribbon protein